MNDIIQTLMQSITAGAYPAPKTGTYSPCFVTGPGGTAVTTIRHLKKQLMLHGVQHVRLLAVDSNDAENGRFLSQLPPLEMDRELKILDQVEALRMLANAQKGTANRHLLQWLPDKNRETQGIHQIVADKINRQKGAGQFRRSGRLLLCANARAGANLDDAFAGIRQELIGLPTVLSQEASGLTVDTGVKVFVVCSAAGGQGAGCLLDYLALLRKHFNGPHDTITALVVLPGRLFDEVVRNPTEEAKTMRANAIGLLRELQAAKLGHFADREFVFDDDLRVRPGTLPLVNDVFLVDHATHALVPLKDLMDLYKGIATWIYSIVGTGVGAHSAFSRINGKTDGHTGKDRLSRPFSALGVGAVRFPAAELVEFGIRDALDRWLSRWSASASDTKTREADIATFLSAGQLSSIDSLRNCLTPDIQEAIFLSDPAQKALVLRLPDPDFLAKGKSKLERFSNELEAYGNAFAERVESTSASLESALSEQCMHWLSQGPTIAGSQLAALRQAINELKTTASTGQATRDQERQSLMDRMEVLVKKVNFWGFGLDAKYRRSYLTVINAVLALQVQERADAAMNEGLRRFERALVNLIAEVENFVGDLQLFRETNNRCLSELIAQDAGSCFMQSVIPAPDYPKWAAANQADVPNGLRPVSLKWDAFVAQAVQSVARAYLSRKDQFDLIGEALKEEIMLARVMTIDTASKYLLRMDLTAPSPAQLSPEKFLAGCVTGSNSNIVGEFPPPEGGAQVVPIELTNRHIIICSRTLHGISVTAWSGYEEAEGHYREDSWWSHAVPNFDELPPLRPLSEERSEALRILGLGLCFELVHSRRSYYYRNVSREELTNQRFLRYFKKDLSEGGTALVAASLVLPAPASQTKVRQDDLLGRSLSESLGGLSKPETGAFKLLVNEVLDEFATKAGVNELRKLIESFVNGGLDRLIQQATDNRTEWEEIARELRAYANRLA